jgi:3-oxoacyl-[acyl-carrier protein] reductase
MSDPLSLAGRVALVTGAGGAIGGATARALARAGALVGLLDKDAVTVTRTAEEIGVAGGEALPFPADVTDAFAVERMVDHVVEEWGRLDVLVNLCALRGEAPLSEVTDEEWDEVLDVNLHGVLVTTRAAVPHMLQRGSGRIVSATSITARLGAPNQTVAAACLAGVVGMTRTWARELGPRGITANCVAAGMIEGPGVSALSAAARTELEARIPVGRLGRPEEVANVFVFLASDLASFMNGAVVGVDGGLMLAI